jgi:hypothetical protein
MSAEGLDVSFGDEGDIAWQKRRSQWHLGSCQKEPKKSQETKNFAA